MDNVDGFIDTIKNFLVNSIVLTQQGNSVLITQVEFYLKDHSIDDVAIITKVDQYMTDLEVSFEKCQEGRGSWIKLRFNINRFEITATGVCQWTPLPVLECCKTTKREGASSNRFSTPRSLRLTDTEPKGYDTICSRFIKLINKEKYTKTKKKQLKRDLIEIGFYQALRLSTSK
ncbi:unnamed protein product [Mucor hiemalis]